MTPTAIGRLMTLGGKELRLLLRDRHGLMVLFLMPTVFILIMSLAMRDAFDPDAGPALITQVYNHDYGELGERVAGQLFESGNVARPVDDRQIDFTLIIPPDFTDRLFHSPDDPETSILSWQASPRVLPQARSAFRTVLINAVLAVQGSELIELLADDMDPEELERLRQVLDPGQWHLEQEVTGRHALPPSAVQQNVPAWLVFAMFFVVIPLSTAMIVEREQGTAMRLSAMGVPAWQLLGSRLPPYLLVNFLQMLAMLAVGIWLVPLFGGEALDLDGRLWHLVPIGLCTGMAAIGLALMVSVLARTGIQAIAMGGTLNLVFGALGGIMVPKMVMPEAMQDATVLSPMSWALEGFWSILLHHNGPLAAGTEMGGLVLFGLICLVGAILIDRKRKL